MPTENIEKALETIKEQLDNEKKVAQILADSADEIVKAQTEKFEAFLKNLDSLTEKVDALATKLDAINVPNIEEIEKSINSKVEAAKADVDAKVEELTKAATAQAAKVETIEKSVEAIESEPVSKSVKFVEPAAEEVVAEEVPAAPTADDLINKALGEMQTCSDLERARELQKAIVRLNSGISPDLVKF